MRLRTGHGPDDWTQNLPGAAPSLATHYGGALIVGESERDRQRRIETASRERRKLKSQHPSYGQLCGAQLVKSGGMCGRGLGHAREHRTAESLEIERQRKRKGPRVAV